jgi:predicted GTPase
MRELLQQAIAVIEKLPAEVQDAIATRLLAEAADEQAWAAQFEATTDTQWDRMAETVRRAIVAEDLRPLDDVFPPREPS